MASGFPLRLVEPRIDLQLSFVPVWEFLEFSPSTLPHRKSLIHSFADQKSVATFDGEG